ncbi:twitchin-like [Diadema setosum]|uniref:twitchin-like n=1 Tax=Diadema setosum TaxID=31175 RepID=UPI003B3AA43A
MGRWVRVNRTPIRETTLKITDLVEKSEYEFRVLAENKIGTGEPSAPSAHVPDKPDRPDVTNVDKTEMTVTWTAPYSDGGAKITAYILEMKEPFSSRWSPVTKTTDMTFQVTRLKEGKEYQFRVSAENKAGVSQPSEPSRTYTAKSPFDVPGAPDTPELTDIKDFSLTVNWSPPRDDGGSPILGYYVEQKDKFSSRWQRVKSSPIMDLKYTVTNIPEDAECEFRVIALNKAGEGKPSPSVALKFRLPSQPGTPEIYNVTEKSVDLRWTPPTDHGGCRLSGYFVEKCEVGKDQWVRINRTAMREANFVVGDLSLNCKYKFRVSAENKAGVGPPSDATDAVLIKLPFDVPDEPDTPTISDVTNDSMVLSWQPPFSDGGSPITDYIVEKKEPYSSRWTPATKTRSLSFKVTGLKENGDYEFRVAAQNMAGVGKFSSPTPVTKAKLPYNVPTAPQSIKISDISPTAVTLNWTEPDSDGGSSVTGYIIEKKDRYSPRWTPVNQTPITDCKFRVTGLKENQECDFRVVAVNKAGSSSPSSAATFTIKPPEAPSKPDVKKVTENSVTLTWSPPESDGGSPVTNYIVEKREPDRDRWVKATRAPITDTAFTVTDLAPKREYEFRVIAENKSGASVASEPSKSVIAKPPYDVPEVPGQPEVSNVTKSGLTLTWEPPEFDGGSPITNYVVEMKDRFSVRWSTLGRPNKTIYKVTGLRQGSEYEFQVRAENKAGVGEPSLSTRPVVAKDPYDVPGPPSRPETSNVTETSVTLTWTPPTSDGGSPITGYIVEKKEDFMTRWVVVTKESGRIGIQLPGHRGEQGRTKPAQ